MDAIELAKLLSDRTAGPGFGIPGGGYVLDVIDAMEANGRSFITTGFEGSGALMAGAIGRLSGSPGLAMSIKGPGFANLAAGLATCHLEALPVIAAIEAYGFNTPNSKQHKKLGHHGIAHDVAKAYIGLDKGSKEIASICDAASAERPGPAILEMANTGDPSEDHDLRITEAPRETFSDTDTFYRTLDAAAAPVLIAGALASRLKLMDELGELKIPVFTTAGAKGAIDERRAAAAGVFTGAGAKLAPETTILAKADLVVGIGLRASEVLSIDTLPCPMISIDAVAPEAPELYDACVPVKEVGRTLNILASKEWGLELIDTSMERMRTELLGGDFLPAHCFQIIRRTLANEYRLVLDTGHFCTVGEHLGEVSAPDRYLSSAMGRSMGAALPLAIGGAIHSAECGSELPTILAIGDGGIGMYFFELRIAVARKLPVLTIFFSDGAFGSIRSAAKVKGATERPLLISSPSWRKSADALGMWSACASNEQEFADALQSWHPNEGPGFIEVTFPPDPYRDMTIDLRH
jgi:acetolactate synthase-1/2/3 large subunit